MKKRTKKPALSLSQYLFAFSLCLALAILLGVAARAAETDVPLGDPVLIQHYEVSNNGFAIMEDTQDQEVQIRTLLVQDTLCYSLMDLAKATDNDTTVWELGYSRFLFHGSWDHPKYTVPVYRLSVNGKDYELHTVDTYAEPRHDLMLTTDDSVTFVISAANADNGFVWQVYDGEPYCSASGVKNLFGVYVDANQNLNLLNPSVSANDFSFLRRSSISAETKSMWLSALWDLYNQYPEGYELVCAETKRIQAVDEATTIARCGQEAAAFVMWNNPGVIYANLDRLSDPIFLAGTWCHECSHLRQFRHRDRSETTPTLIQVKALYALGYDHNRLTRWLQSLAGNYEAGAALGLQFLAEQDQEVQAGE